MTDYIKRADAIEAVRKKLQDWGSYAFEDYRRGLYEAQDIIEALPSADAEPKENHTQATGAKHVIKSLGTDIITHNGIDCTEFIHWLMEEVMDDEMWGLNAVGNGEIICRKLKKLGLLEVKDGYYIRPSADAVHGEWIDIDNYYRLATCSHCHKVTMFEKWGEYTKPYNFCPNCGARMTPYKGGDDE